MDRYVLSANLVNAIQKYLVARPFAEVANIVLALQQQINAQVQQEGGEQAGEQEGQ